jgi:hypothetical protein
MATTTTNYGFDVPTSSDLVKNGATAISTLGQDLDTFLFRPFTRNAVINGGMDIWQRGTSIAYGINTGVYTADRWTTLRTASPSGATVSRQTSSLTGIQYCARVQRDSGNTSTAAMYFGTNLESADSYRFAGQTVTLSYYARKGANYSPTSSELIGYIYTGTGTDQSFVSGFTGGVQNAGNVTLTTSWQRFTITATIPSNATQIAIYYAMTPTGTAGAADYYEITGVQFEVGNQASPFIRAADGTIQGELAACQRYFEKSYDTNVAPATASQAAGINMAISATSVANNTTYMTPVFRVDKRTTPTVTCYSYAGTAGAASKVSDGLDLSANTATAKNIGMTGFWVYNLNASTFTTTQGAMFQWTASAEL